MNFYIFVTTASALIIAFWYMLFDVFNRRQVPNLFVYSTLIYSFIMLLSTMSLHLILWGSFIALLITAAGYVVYKIGQIGLGDVLEFAALSMLIITLSGPLLSHVAIGSQLLSVVSLFLDTGIVAVIFVPFYYIAVAARKYKNKLTSKITRSDMTRSLVILASYIIFGLVLVEISYAKVMLLVLLFLMMVGSSLLMLFQRPITSVMIEEVGYDKFEEDDIIAFNLMSSREISSAKKRIASFDRLVTKQLIREMKAKKIKDKFPVYKNAVPFAVPIFFGLVATILFGNLLLLVLLS